MSWGTNAGFCLFYSSDKHEKVRFLLSYEELRSWHDDTYDIFMSEAWMRADTQVDVEAPDEAR